MHVELTSHDIAAPAQKTRHYRAASCYLSGWYIHHTILQQAPRARLLRSAAASGTASVNRNLWEQRREGHQEYRVSLIHPEKEQANIKTTKT